jgi:pSer/pThr/pTyr-binding forkhead associated (FHA) protein
MKRTWLILCCCVCFSYSYAQQGSLKGEIDTKNFPEVSFIWNEYNPNILDTLQFSVKENGIEVVTKIEHIEVDSIPNTSKSILLLWENQPFYDQLFFTQQVLRRFITGIQNTNDTTTKFNIASFSNILQDDNAILKIALPNFTNNWSVIENEFFDKWVYDDNTNTEYYIRDTGRPVRTNLSMALKEGLDLIGKESRNNTRAIVVVTAGLFVPEVEISPIITLSLQNKIPVYIVKYPSSADDNTFISQLTRGTHGQLILSDGNHESTTEELLIFFNNLNRRHYGQDYKITFTSQLRRNSNSYPLVLYSNGVPHDIISYKTPRFSLIVWAKQNLILFIILLVVSITAITFGIIFGIKFLKKRKARISAQKQEEERQKSIQLAKQVKLEREQRELQEKLRQQQKATEQKERQSREQEQVERLTKLMRSKNLQPHLIAVSEGVTFSIDKVTTTIGKGNDNDIVFSDSTVSRHHAKIIFNGSIFELYDENSTNGTIVNGNYIESAELKSSDIIQFGEVVTKFYL